MDTSPDPRLEKARALLESGALPLSALAAEVGLSPAYLQKRFKQAYGLSPAEYAGQRRLMRLKRRLRETDDVTQAWVDCGFGSCSRVYENGAAKLGMLPLQYRKGGRGLRIHWTVIDTALGKALVAATARGICTVALADSQDTLLAELRQEFPEAELNHVPDDDGAIAPTVRAVADALAGKTAVLPLELLGTAFQHRVWQVLMRIPAGETFSYAELAQALDMPQAARAVARACAGNKVAVLVPCHRIVRGDGTLGGYRWGVLRKQKLLARERMR